MYTPNNNNNDGNNNVHCYVDALSASIALGLPLSWFPTLARTKLVSNNCKEMIVSKIVKFE